MEEIEKYSDLIVNNVVEYAPQVIGAIITLIVGLWIIKILTKGLKRLMNKREWDDSLKSFVNSLSGIVLKILLVVSVIGMVGVEMTSFIAILGAAGLAVGMALSGTLQNFAGGVIILIFKPYKVGDVIEAQGYIGKVTEIQIFNTIMKTADNKTIIIPNGGLATGSLTNYSTEATRRVDFSFGIAYGDDYDNAKNVLLQIIGQDERILKDPEPFIALGQLADSSVNITTRVWVNSADYWAVHFDMNEKVYKEFAKNGINIPFPQMDVHITKN